MKEAFQCCFRAICRTCEEDYVAELSSKRSLMLRCDIAASKTVFESNKRVKIQSWVS
jgi:hypothetical protein